MASSDIDQLREKANPRTGLVAVKVLRPFMPYGAGQVVGFPPDVAWSHINLGNVEEYGGAGRNEDRRMLGMTGPAPGTGSAPRVPGPRVATRNTRYDRRPEVSPKAQVAPKLDNEPVLQEQIPADIPENWQDFDGASRRRLAADLSGRRYQELSADDATKIIQANIDGTQDQEPATASYSGTVFGDDDGLNGVVSTRSFEATRGNESQKQPRARSGAAKKRSSSKKSSGGSRSRKPAPQPGEEDGA
jgi:hypothetical protein